MPQKGFSDINHKVENLRFIIKLFKRVSPKNVLRILRFLKLIDFKITYNRKTQKSLIKIQFNR